LTLLRAGICKRYARLRRAQNLWLAAEITILAEVKFHRKRHRACASTKKSTRQYKKNRHHLLPSVPV
jgi:hypothetical protein